MSQILIVPFQMQMVYNKSSGENKGSGRTEGIRKYAMQPALLRTALQCVQAKDRKQMIRLIRVPVLTRADPFVSPPSPASSEDPPPATNDIRNTAQKSKSISPKALPVPLPNESHHQDADFLERFLQPGPSSSRGLGPSSSSSQRNSLCYTPGRRPRSGGCHCAKLGRRFRHLHCARHAPTSGTINTFAIPATPSAAAQTHLNSVCRHPASNVITQYIRFPNRISGNHRVSLAPRTTTPISGTSTQLYRPGLQPKSVYRLRTDEFAEARKSKRSVGKTERMRLERQLEKLISLHFSEPAFGNV